MEFKEKVFRIFMLIGLIGLICMCNVNAQSYIERNDKGMYEYDTMLVLDGDKSIILEEVLDNVNMYLYTNNDAPITFITDDNTLLYVDGFFISYAVIKLNAIKINYKLKIKIDDNLLYLCFNNFSCDGNLFELDTFKNKQTILKRTDEEINKVIEFF